MTTETDSFSGSEFAGCRVIEKIGQGGMGAVYTARLLSLDKTVCIKILSPELAVDRRNVEFFLREARSAAKLDHPNIVHVYNFGLENGLYFILMSHIEGRSLDAVVENGGPLSTEAATDIMLEVLAGLQHAHSKTIIHRDIKPSNILLGSDGHSKIVDFGLARSISEEKLLTMAGEMIGTAYFMSPEQGLAETVDHRADIYSAGATYFYLLTGKYPFEGKNSIEVIHKHIGEPFPNILVLKPDVPLWLSGVLDRMTRKRPKDRYQSAEEAATDIRNRLEAEKNGTAATMERSIAMPELEARLEEEMKASLERPAEKAVFGGRKPAEIPGGSLYRPRDILEPDESEQPPAGSDSLAVRYAAAAAAALCCFLLAGAAGAPASGVRAAMLSPFASRPAAALFLLAAGLCLTAWTAMMKPRKFTPAHALLSSAAALAAYAGTAGIPSPAHMGMSEKLFLCLKTAAMNAFSHASLPAYFVFLFLAAAKLSAWPRKEAKAAAAASFLLSAALVYAYFGRAIQGSPGGIYFLLAAAAAAGGITALIRKKSGILYNPIFLFFAAGALIPAMFAAPRVAAMTEASVRRNAEQVLEYNREVRERRQAAQILREATLVEFDQDGRPMQRARTAADPVEAAPAPRATLAALAAFEYARALAGTLARNFLETAGLVLLAALLLLLAAACAAEEIILEDDGGDGPAWARRD